jgi:hypothetical protein
MKKFSLVSSTDLSKINGNSLKVLAPDRQVKAMRLWADQNIKRHGPAGGSDSDEEMQTFISDMGKHFNLYVDNPSFQMALKQQKGWGNEWKEKVVDQNGANVDVDRYDPTMKGVLKKIVEENGRGHHGNTTLSGRHGSCLHWVSGSQRIFGTFANGRLTLIGIGRHGSSNSTYTVELVNGGTATATT